MEIDFKDYKEAMEMSTEELFDYVDSNKGDIAINVTTPAEAEDAALLSQALANTYSYLSSLYSYAKLYKRQLGRINKKSPEYEDAIDKETIISEAMKSLDLQHRSLSKALTLYMEEMRRG